MIDTPHVVQTTPVTAAVIHLTVPREQIQTVMGPAISEVLAVLKAQGLSPAGPMFSHHLSMPSATFNFEVGFPVASAITASGRVKPTQLPAMRVARTVYQGGYEGLHTGWVALKEWLGQSGHQSGATLLERYLAGPETTPDPTGWRTELNQPLL